MTSATDELRRLLDERGVEWMPSVFDPQHETFYSVENGVGFIVTEFPEIQRMSLACDMRITPEQAVEATLGRVAWSNPTWERWHQSLRHESIETIGDAVEQLMYEAIEFGGDMGPNGNVCEGIDEGDVLTSGFINSWVERFATLGRGTCHAVFEVDAMSEDERVGEYVCSECGETFNDGHGEFPHYCPNCGRMVE